MCIRDRLMVALTVVSFQAERFLSHSGLLTVLVLAVLLFNSILIIHLSVHIH